MSKPIVFGNYNPIANTAHIILNGTHYNLDGDKAEESYTALVNYSRNTTVENLEALQDAVAPKIRLIKNLFNGSFYKNETSGEYFMEGTTVPLPPALVQLFEKYETNNWPIEALANFWSLCLLNPNETARDGFLKYCLDFGVVITDMGYAVLYKAVTHKKKVSKDEDLAAFVAENVTRVKRQRKGLSRYSVYRVPEETVLGNNDVVQPGFFLTQTDYTNNRSFKLVGNLQELHDNIDELSRTSGTVYTDKHTRQMDIYLGVPQFKNRSECDPNINVACSHGLHVGSYQYVKSFAKYSDSILACFVNPANVVALPKYDHSKIRVCEYYPYSVMERQEEDFTDDEGTYHPKGSWFELEDSYLQSDYAAYEIDDLKKGVFKEQKMTEVVVARMQQINQFQKDTLEPKVQAPHDSV